MSPVRVRLPRVFASKRKKEGDGARARAASQSAPTHWKVAIANAPRTATPTYPAAVSIAIVDQLPHHWPPEHRATPRPTAAVAVPA
jgi:hypothetical protein